MLTEVLTLERPFLVFDLESTGTNPREDRIVQIGLIKIETDGTEHEGCELINPGIPIPSDATRVHGINDDMVKDAPTFKSVATRLAKGFSSCDVGGFNISGFDVELIENEFKRAGVECQMGQIIDAFEIFRTKEKRSLDAALKFYCDEEMVDHHDALADSRAAAKIIKAQLLRYPDLPRTVAGLHKLFMDTPKPGFADSKGKLKWVGDDLHLAVGKWKGTPLQKVPRKYLEWMLGDSFPADTKKIIEKFLAGEPIQRA